MRKAIWSWLSDVFVEDVVSAVTTVIRYPDHKPPAFVTIDDRAITFTGTFPSIDELLAFQPWNKRERTT